MGELITLTPENYHSKEANRDYMSSSIFKEIAYEGCEAKAVAKLYGEYEETEPKKAFLQGNFVHSWLEGPSSHEVWKQEHYHLIYKKRPAGELYAEFAKMGDLIEVLKNDKKLMYALEGEPEQIITWYMFGVPWKAKIDRINHEKKRFTDLKVMKDIYEKFWNSEERTYQNFIYQYNYEVSMSIYAQGIKTYFELNEYYDPFIASITKQEPPARKIFKGFTEDIIKASLAEVEQNLPHVLKVKNREIEPQYCGKCDYCRKVLETEVIDYHCLIV